MNMCMVDEEEDGTKERFCMLHGMDGEEVFKRKIIQMA